LSDAKSRRESIRRRRTFGGRNRWGNHSAQNKLNDFWVVPTSLWFEGAALNVNLFAQHA
jgi:hypothetical protein